MMVGHRFMVLQTYRHGPAVEVITPYGWQIFAVNPEMLAYLWESLWEWASRRAMGPLRKLGVWVELEDRCVLETE
jgi:hypothetical protein